MVCIHLYHRLAQTSHINVQNKTEKRGGKNQALDIVYSIMAGSFKYKFDPNE